MYLIIDNNVTHQFADPNNLDSLAILHWSKGAGKLIAGGELLREYNPENGGNTKFMKLFNVLRSAGRALTLSDSDVDQVSAILKSSGKLRSDDYHIIAIAQLSGARALWSRDKNARKDFKNKALIDHPRGVIYLPEGNNRRRAACLRAISRVCT